MQMTTYGLLVQVMGMYLGIIRDIFISGLSRKKIKKYFGLQKI